MDDFKKDINVSSGDTVNVRTSSSENTPSSDTPTSFGSDSNRSEPPKAKGKKISLGIFKSKWAKLFLVVVVLALIGGGFAYQMQANNKLKKENQKLSNPQEAAKAESDKIKNEVAQLIELPNETPTIATVVDASKLKDQAFFANAQNGDRVLLFPQAKKAILYRPSTHKIIEVAPINIGNNATPAATATPTTTTPTTKKP